jgi:epoxyqueuosine reductase
MEKDINEAEILPTESTNATGKRIKYCRRCELACPVGRPSKDK